jgi:radical SAM protein with 4Fe4S-binding SPASM domain
MTIRDTDDWIPPTAQDLRFIERDGRWLCLNPAVPGWVITTEAGALLLQLADGRRSVQNIGDLLRSNGIEVDQTDVAAFFADAKGGKLYDTNRGVVDPLELWRERRLTAMHLHLTDRCNLECTYCLRDSSPRVPIRHPPERFVELFDYVKPFVSHQLDLTFTGGEPLMYPGFAHVVEAASDHGFRNLLYTNGILVNEARAQFIARHFAHIQVSLDGADAQAHAQTRGNNADRVLRGIRLLAEAGAPVTVQVTVSTSNRDSASRVRSVLPEGVQVRYTPVMPHGRGAYVQELFLTNDEFVTFSRSIADKGAGAVEYQPGMPTRSCYAGLSNLSISDSGDAYPCHLFHRPEFRFGNVFHDRFEDIFFGEPIRSYVAGMDVTRNNPVCAGCEVRYLCGGGCKANTLAVTGDWHGVDMWCGYLKTTIFESLFRSTDAADTPVELDRRNAVVSSL